MALPLIYYIDFLLCLHKNFLTCASSIFATALNYFILIGLQQFSIVSTLANLIYLLPTTSIFQDFQLEKW